MLLLLSATHFWLVVTLTEELLAEMNLNENEMKTPPPTASANAIKVCHSQDLKSALAVHKEQSHTCQSSGSFDYFLRLSTESDRVQ